MAPCRFGEFCWRPLYPVSAQREGRTARLAAVWALQEEEILDVIKDSSVECILERIMEQTVELAGFFGEAWSSGPGVNDTISGRRHSSREVCS